MRRKKTDLSSLRQKIDAVDGRLVRLLNERVKLALEVSDVKRAQGASFYTPEREAALLDRVRKLNDDGVIPDDIMEFLFTQIMSVTFHMGAPLTIAYFGPAGTHTHMAAIRKFGEKVDLNPYDDITSVFRAVESGEASFGVVPVENSTEGMVSHTLDMFIDSPLKICSEAVLRIRHCLLARSGGIDTVKKIYTHPQILAQCRGWLQRHLPRVELVPAGSSAAAAQMVRTQKNAACIGSEAAVGTYGLKILARNVQDNQDNCTRFLVIGTYETKPSGCDKTSVFFSMEDKAGALYEMLLPFKKHNVNLTKIESRPLKKKLWQYYFFVDMQGHSEDAQVKAALNEVAARAQLFKVMGSYPRAR